MSSSHHTISKYDITKTIHRQLLNTTPIWLMRQAGRYLPEYQALRQQAGGFMRLCQDPELACAVTLQPLQRFNVDAAIIFSDILTIPDALGLELSFHEGRGPLLARTIRSEHDLVQLPELVPEDQLAYVLAAIKLTKAALSTHIPLIGFCGSPWTLACYMIAGSPGDKFRLAQQAVHIAASWLPKLLAHLAQAVSEHLCAQIKAGADIIMIFDTWGELLSDTEYSKYSLQYLHRIVQYCRAKQPEHPIIIYTRGDYKRFVAVQTTGCDVVGIGNDRIDLNLVRAQLGRSCALQGNLKPDILLESRKVIKQEVSRILAEYGHGSGHIFNLSQGITPNIPPDNVAFLIDTVHELSTQYHTT